MTYARARLWLGISSVGTIVLLAVVSLALQLPQKLLPTQPVALEAALPLLLTVFGIYLFMSMPFDILGGYVLPQCFRRPVPAAGRWLLSWATGTAIQLVWMIGLAVALLSLANRFGDLVAFFGIVVASLGLLLGQTWVARMVGRLRPTSTSLDVDLAPTRLWLQRLGMRQSNVVTLDHQDPGFTGGWVGLPGREKLLLPRIWLQTLTPDQLAAAVVHRIGALRSGARWRGIVVALGWNLTGLAMAFLFPEAAFSSVAGLVTIALLFTLWSFLGALILPSISRPAVLAADRFARKQGVSPHTLAQAFQKIDAIQDDEAQRSKGIETIFHPIPSPATRLQNLGLMTDAPGGAWHAARLALFLSWACFGLLGRAVHCNCGRPELWVLLPAD